MQEKIICKRCGRTMSYDPYFKKYVCRTCGNVEEVEGNVKQADRI